MRLFDGRRAAMLRVVVGVCAAGFGVLQAAAPVSAAGVYAESGSLTGLISYSNLGIQPGCPYGSFHAGGIGAGAGAGIGDGVTAGEPFADLDATALQCSLGMVNGSMSVSLQNSGVGSIVCLQMSGSYSTVGAIFETSVSGTCTINGINQFLTFDLVGILEGPAYTGVFALAS